MVLYPHDAITLAAIVRNLAGRCPPVSRNDECFYCESTDLCTLPPFDPDRVRIDDVDLVRPDPSTHAEDCPWRQAVEWVAEHGPGPQPTTADDIERA